MSPERDSIYASALGEKQQQQQIILEFYSYYFKKSDHKMSDVVTYLLTLAIGFHKDYQ